MIIKILYEIASAYCDERYAFAIVSMIPSITPPIIAPGTEPIPPSYDSIDEIMESNYDDVLTAVNFIKAYYPDSEL